MPLTVLVLVVMVHRGGEEVVAVEELEGHRPEGLRLTFGLIGLR